MNRSELACGTELQLLQDSKLECRTSYLFAHFRAVPVIPWVPWDLERPVKFLLRGTKFF